MKTISQRIDYIAKLTHTPRPDLIDLRNDYKFPVNSSHFRLSQYLSYRNLLYSEYAVQVGAFSITHYALVELRIIIVMKPELLRNTHLARNDLLVWKCWLKHLASPRPLPTDCFLASDDFNEWNRVF